MDNPVLCPGCGSEMVLKRTNKFTTKDGQPRKFYGCSKWPECRETHGAHPDGTPLGTPGDQETRDLRRQLHALMDEIWPWDDKRRKKQGYTWLRFNSKSGHVGEMQKEELLETIAKVKELLDRGNVGPWRN